jgi:hypothetical protein
LVFVFGFGFGFDLVFVFVLVGQALPPAVFNASTPRQVGQIPAGVNTSSPRQVGQLAVFNAPSPNQLVHIAHGATPVTSIYTKLTPRNRSPLGYTQLFLAPDHILLLINHRFSEEYKRFAFADIQSIVVTESPSRVILQVIMILAALTWMALSLTVHSPFGKWAFIVTGLLMLLWPIIDIARGPRCRCFLHTSVSRELLEPVSRISTAVAFLAAIRPRIEAAQGVLTSIPEPSPPSEAPPPELVSTPGYLPELLFGTFLINALLIWLSMHYPKIQQIPGVMINTMLAEILLIVVSLVRRKGRDERIIIYVVMVLAIIGIGYDVSTVAREVVGWFMDTIEKAKTGKSNPPAFSFFFGKAGVIAYSWRIAAGVIGLAAAFYERRRLAAKVSVGK